MASACIDAHFCTELGGLGPKPPNVLDCFGMGGKSNIAGWKIPEPNGGFNGKITINGLLWAGVLTSDTLCYV